LIRLIRPIQSIRHLSTSPFICQKLIDGQQPLGAVGVAAEDGGYQPFCPMGR